MYHVGKIFFYISGLENIGDTVANSVKMASTKSHHSSVNDAVVMGDYIFTLVCLYMSVEFSSKVVFTINVMSLKLKLLDTS
jgi:hypothetical protein